MRKPMTDEEWMSWKDVVKCNWLKCAGGMGLAGNGCCSFRGDFDKVDCDKFITDDDYEKNTSYESSMDTATKYSDKYKGY